MTSGKASARPEPRHKAKLSDAQSAHFGPFWRLCGPI